jgi:glutamate dehydrogenase
LHDGIVSALADVRHAVDDWPAMNAQMRAAIDATRKIPPPLDPDETGEDLEFLEWLAAHHFTFLGYRDYDLVGCNN